MNHASKIKRRKVHPVKWTTWRLRIPHIQIGQNVCNLRADWKPSQTRCNPDPFSGANERSQPRNCKWLMSYERRKQNPPRWGAPQIEQASGRTIPERIIQKPDVGLAKNLPQTNRRQRRMALSCQYPFTPRIRTHVAPEKSLYLGDLYAKTQYFLSFSAYFWRRSWLSPFLYIPLHRIWKNCWPIVENCWPINKVFGIILGLFGLIKNIDNIDNFWLYENRFTTYISICPLHRRSGSALLRNLYRPTRRDPLLSPCCLRRNSHLRRRTVWNRLRL